MIVINVIMFLISLVLSGKAILVTLNPLFFFTPSRDVLIFLGAAGIRPVSQFDFWWSPVSASWLHGGLLHLVFNMMALKTVVPLVIKEFGVSRMFIIYTLSGVAGFLLSYIGRVDLTIGASAGLCGLIGAALYFGKARGGQWGQLVFQQTRGWVISLAVIGFLLPIINNWGHGGGLVAGIFFGWLLQYTEIRKEHIIDRFLAIACVIVTLGLLLWRVAYGLTLAFIG